MERHTGLSKSNSIWSRGTNVESYCSMRSRWDLTRPKLTKVNKIFDADNEQEKITRNRFKFEAEKNLNIETVVIVDSMNYIKGYRYQMYCIAREMKTTYCVVFCNASLEQARIFNQKNENRYPEAL